MNTDMRHKSGRYRVSVRESRLVAERLLLTLGIPSGYVGAVRECILHSQALGLGGFAHLNANLDALRAPGLEAIRIAETTTSTVSADCRGVHAWMALPTLFDLAVSFARRAGRSELEIRGAVSPSEFGVARALAHRYGAVATLDTAANDMVRIKVMNATSPNRLEQWDPFLVEALHQGYDVDATLWRKLYALSKEALAPDSALSRRHAGPVVLLDDGSILGRQPEDDDFDPEMLKNVGVTAKPNTQAMSDETDA